MPEAPQYDVAIVGASLAGCTAARLFAQHGLSVALVEQHANLDWHKRMCTHYIQACAAPTIGRLGLASLLDNVGAVRSRMEIWTRWGWIKHVSETPETYGYSVRRKTLDPIVRRLAASTPGVELMTGWTACQVLRDRGRPIGLALRDPNGETLYVTARLVVAADGRHSSIGELEQVPKWTKPNQRFAYFAYYRNLRLTSGNDSQFWLLDPDAAYALPNEDGITLLCCWPTKEKMAAFRADRHGSFEQFIRALPGGPDLSGAERISEIQGALDTPIELRGGTHAGLALIGDAALAPDPLWGVGCGWAFQSAEWLVDSVAPALLKGKHLKSALRRYYKLHRWELCTHYATIASYAAGRRFSSLERFFFSAGARDAALAEILLAFGARRVSAWRLLAPSTVARAAWSKLRPSKPPLESAIAEPTATQPAAEIEAQAAVERQNN